MAVLITFPIARDVLSDKLRLAATRMRLMGYQDISMAGGGDILVADMAPKAWVGTAEMDVLTFRQAAEIQALIESLDESQNSFYLSDPRAPYPWYDPEGEILEGMFGTIKIAELDGSNKRLKIKNAPNGFRFQRGVKFHFDFGADPVHRAFHDIVSSQEIADGDGLTDWIEVRPHIRTGAAVNDVLTFAKPALEVKIVPGTFQEGEARNMVVSGMGFQWRQVI